MIRKLTKFSVNFLKDVYILKRDQLTGIKLENEKNDFFEINKTKWQDEKYQFTNEYILIEGFLSTYGINYLYRTGIVSNAIRKHESTLTPLVIYDDFYLPHRETVKLYQSFQIYKSIFLKQHLSTFYFSVKAYLKARLHFKKLKTGDDILDTSINGIHIGDILYDDITHSDKSIKTIELVRKDFFIYLYRSYFCIYKYQRIFNKYNIKYLVSTHPCYLQYGILCRIALKNQASILSTTDIEVMFLDHKLKSNQKNSPVYHEFVSRYVDYYLKRFEITKEDLEQTKNYLRSRFEAKIDQVDVQLAFKDKKEYSKNELKQTLKIENDYPNVFIMTHIVSDAPHTSYHMIYRDYFVWLKETIKICSEINGINWIVKPHPASKLYKEENLVKDLVSELGANNIFVAPDNFNTSSISQIADCILTVQGTAGLEFSCVGIPVILTGKPFYCDFGFTHNVDTKEEYIHILKNIRRIRKLTTDEQEKALKILTAFRNYSISENLVIKSDILLMIWGYHDRDLKNIFHSVNSNLKESNLCQEPQYERTLEFLRFYKADINN